MPDGSLALKRARSRHARSAAADALRGGALSGQSPTVEGPAPHRAACPQPPPNIRYPMSCEDIEPEDEPFATLRAFVEAGIRAQKALDRLAEEEVCAYCRRPPEEC